MRGSRSQEQHSHQNCGNRQNRTYGNNSVRIGVHSTGPAPRLLLNCGVPFQPERSTAHQKEGACQNRSMTAERGGSSYTAWANLNTTVEVVHNSTANSAEHDNSGQKINHQIEERKSENEESNIQPKFGVLNAEVLAVQEKRHGLPLANSGTPNKEP